MKNFFQDLSEDYKKDRIFFLLCILPVCFLPAFLISGPFLPDLTVTICTIYMMYIVTIRKEYNLLNHKIYYFIFIFWLYILISSFFSFDIYLSLSETLFYFRFIFFCIFIFYLLNTYKNFIKYFTIFFLITFIILFLDSYLQYFLGFNVTGNIYNGYRLNSFFGDELKLGSFISRLLPLLVGLLIYILNKNKFSYLIIIFVIINSFIIIILSGERIAFFIFIFFILGSFILMKFNFFYKLISILFFIIACISIISMNTYVYERMFITTKNQILNTNNLNYSFLSRSHHDTFITAYNMFIENPIKGVGVKNFRVLCNENKYWNKTNKIVIQDDGLIMKNDYGCFTHPHNNYMQLLAETGIIGFVFVFGTFLFILLKFIKHFYYMLIKLDKKIINNHLISIYLSVFITLIPFIPSGNFFNNWLSIIYFFPVGFIIYFDRKK